LAAQTPAFVSLINPADPRFISPDEMPGRIAAFCKETGQPAPDSPGAFARCVFESLALYYRVVLRQLEQLTARKLEQLNIVGGGSRNMLLNQFAANALQIPVVAGPAECTALGNVLVQAITQGHISSLVAARGVVRNSFEVATVKPQAATGWDAAFRRFEKLLK
jgi:rhamnulokinase